MQPIINATRVWQGHRVPHLEYCVCIVAAPHYERDQEKLEMVQHRFTRRLLGIRGFEKKEETGEIECVDSEREKKSLGLDRIVQNFYEIACHSMGEVFPCRYSGQTRGHSEQLIKDEFRLDARKFFFLQEWLISLIVNKLYFANLT